MSTRKLGVRPFKNRTFGFTMVELMVSIAILSIITALALPSYTDMTSKRRLTSSAEQMSAFINQGHTEATRRNEVVAASYFRLALDNWCVGITLGEDDCDCRVNDADESDYCAIDGVKRVLNSADLGSGELVHAMRGSGSFSLDPIRGILLDPDDDMLFELHTDGGDYKIDLVLNESGNVKLCSHDDGHAVPDYKVC